MAAMLNWVSQIFVERSTIPPPGWAGKEKVLHRFTFEQYSLCKKIGPGEKINSDVFTAGGHQWVVAVIPELEAEPSDTTSEDEVFLALIIGLVNSEKSGCGVGLFYQMTLLDQSGKGNHLTRYFPSTPDSEPKIIKPNEYAGYRYFIGQNRLEQSHYLKDDCLKIECRISVVLPSYATHGPRLTPSDSSIDRAGFISLLDTGYGSDAVFSVRGEEFRVHKDILSARSSLFRSMFAVSEKKQEAFIIDMEPRVFKVLLHFIYSDTLPEDVMSGFAFGPRVSSTLAAKLLEVAIVYDIMRLKIICEAHIWRSISLGRLAETLLLAERCNASALKCLCLKYAADNYAYLVELDSWKFLGENCPSLLNEVEDYRVTKMKKGDSSSSKERLSKDVNDC